MNLDAISVGEKIYLLPELFDLRVTGLLAYGRPCFRVLTIISISDSN